MCTWIPQPSKHWQNQAFEILYLEMELDSLTVKATLLNEVCIWKWKLWNTWPESWNVDLDSSTFKLKLLNKSLYLEMGGVWKPGQNPEMRTPGSSAFKTKLLNKCLYSKELVRRIGKKCRPRVQCYGWWSHVVYDVCCVCKEVLSSTFLIRCGSLLIRSLKYHGGSGRPGQNLERTPQPSKLSFWTSICIWKWRIWDTWPKSWMRTWTGFLSLQN